MKNKSIAVVLLSWLGPLNFLFTASAQPLVTTLPATGITLNGTVNPNGRSSLGYFQYGPTTDYGYFGGFTVLPATSGTLAVPGFLVNGLTRAAGDNWTNVSQIGPLGPNDALAAIASSADGLRLAAAVGGGSIFTSTNGGVSWTERLGVPHEIWTAIASSADGTRLAAANYSGLATIWASTNSGVSWTPTSAPMGLWVSVASSADGLRLVAGQDTEGIYTSTNGESMDQKQRTGLPMVCHRILRRRSAAGGGGAGAWRGRLDLDERRGELDQDQRPHQRRARV